MQAEYLSQLSAPVRAFVEEVEAGAGLAIEVVPCADLNTGGPAGAGKLSVDIEAQSVRLNAPTNGYFPDGAVRHEVLHMHRLHVEHVPRLAIAEEADWDPGFETSLTRVDNALEHLVIVPVELQHHSERRAHWEGAMARMWETEIPQAPNVLDRRIGACLHWTFLRHVLQTSPQLDLASAVLQKHGLREEADSFADQLVARLGDKTEVARFFFSWFPDVPRDRVALEFLNSVTGTTQHPVPG